MSLLSKAGLILQPVISTSSVIWIFFLIIFITSAAYILLAMTQFVETIVNTINLLIIN